MKTSILILGLLALAMPGWGEAAAPTAEGRWSLERARAWQAANGWLMGTNYIPASAVNELEMWQADTFDPAGIDRELGWASNLGMNCQRVFLHYLAWKQDPEGFFARVDTFLSLAQAHGQKIVFVLNDSVWNPEPRVGPQPAPVPHRHNSGWVQSPGATGLKDPAEFELVGQYVRQTLARFGHDGRVILWDLLNEPDNTNGGRFRTEAWGKISLTYHLLTESFRWAREAAPSQPLTAGLWTGDWSAGGLMEPFNHFQIENSDVITFHSYDPPEGLKHRIAQIAAYGRPAVCTEYMARGAGSTFAACLPLLKAAGVGALNWGFVAGKTNTIFPWDSWTRPYPDDPQPWFHDVLRPDGTPWDPAEAALLRSTAGVR